MPDDQRRVAIACQGGGSHTAFTAGVLSRLFGGPELDRYDVVGLSGTSGGAICALLAWSALRDGDRRKAGALLEGFWADNSASSLPAEAANAWLLGASTLQSLGLLPVVSPYDLPVDGRDELRDLLARRVDFGRIHADPAGAYPLLMLGAVDVVSGRFRTFSSRSEAVTADMVLASAAIPTLFRAVHTDGGTFWDGLFSQNPPVRDLLDAAPDELWVIQINPTARADEPRSVLDIADRRNELAGNLSLDQELHFVEKIDQLLADGVLVGSKYRQVVIRILELDRPRSSQLLGPASKLNRDAGFIHALMDQGERQAEEFLAAVAVEEAWRGGVVDDVLGLLAPDVEVISAAPFPPSRTVGAPARDVVAQVCRTVRMDLTRAQLTRDRAVWTVRFDDAAATRGQVAAQIDGGRVVRLWLGPTPP